MTTPEDRMKDLIAVDNTDEQLYSIVQHAKLIQKAARIARIAAQEKAEAQQTFNEACARSDAAMKRLSDLVLQTK